MTKGTEISIASRDELIRNPTMGLPHVVFLGAGASVASCPSGDVNGRLLPTMDNFVEVVGLADLLSAHKIECGNKNFEDLYSALYGDSSRSALIGEIESRVKEYFSSLKLPGEPTIYDHLLLSLRPKDAIFTFNWDPFLFDAYCRNQNFNLPKIFFLHGNVRVAHCPTHIENWGPLRGVCPTCQAHFSPTSLLYPIRKKNYSANGFIHSNWQAARPILSRAFIFTIFGYGAPQTDTEAINLMRCAWREPNLQSNKRVEIIDIKCRDTLQQTWRDFPFYHHVDYRTCFYDSWIARYPRRSCEALYEPSVQARPSEVFAVPRYLGFKELYDWLNPITGHESRPGADKPQ